MPNLDTTHISNNTRFLAFGRLLTATQPTSGQWFQTFRVRPWSITVGGNFTGTWRVLHANSIAQPTDDNWPQVGDDQATPGSIDLDVAYQWVKVVAVTLSSGTLVADFLGG